VLCCEFHPTNSQLLATGSSDFRCRIYRYCYCCTANDMLLLLCCYCYFCTVPTHPLTHSPTHPLTHMNHICTCTHVYSTFTSEVDGASVNAAPFANALEFGEAYCELATLGWYLAMGTLSILSR